MHVGIDTSYMQHGGGGIRLRQAITSLMSQARVAARHVADTRPVRAGTGAVIGLAPDNGLAMG